MDLPQPPCDQELKNIIDKLAQFVARNGPEFEHMTKQKQKDNPKFSFLFGGTYFHYYQYRVTTEQAILKQKQNRTLEQQAIVQQAINRQSIQTAPWQQHVHPIQDTSQEQIRQSEQNLAAQHQLLLQQQQIQVDEVIRKAQEEKMAKLSQECNLDLKELDGVLQPIIDSCTKDSISTGKGWIFSHATTDAHSEVIIMYILKKVTEPGATFEAKLHLVYLINDVLHHCIRKNAEDLKKKLEKAVVPIFCSTSIGVPVDKTQKLNKLHKLWETNKYFEPNVLEQLQNPAASLAAYQAGLIAEYATLITPITAAIQTQYSLLQKQHQDFVNHLTGQMQQMQIPVPYAFQSAQAAVVPAQVALAAATSPYLQQTQSVYEQPNIQPAVTLQDPRLQVKVLDAVVKQDAEFPPGTEKTNVTPEKETKDTEKVESNFDSEDSHSKDFPAEKEDSLHMRGLGHMHEDITKRPSLYPDNEASSTGMDIDNDYPPPDMCDPGYGHPDMMMRHPNGRQLGPPDYIDDYSPGYRRHPAYEPPEYGMTPPHMGGSYGRHGPFREGPLGPHDIPPEYMDSLPPPISPPYYDLPAGLMVPLVRLEDYDYDKPLDPNDVHLPPPALPTERLLAAVEQFYCPPTLERARNNAYVISSEGWEQLGLYEFFKAKALARKQKFPDEKDYISPSTEDPDILEQPQQEEKQQEQQEEEQQQLQEQEPPIEPPKKEEKVRRYREFKSPPREVAPPSHVRNGSKDRRRSRSRTRSRSKSKTPELSPRRSSRSPSPRPQFNRSRRRTRSRSRSPSDKRRSPHRSQSPPYMGGGGQPRESRLDESNKGHQLLKKMGWGGAGLGAAEQGIQDPVDAGDVRDRQDMYKGIGVNLNDPYENFRKSKGQAFINRMKARAEELGKN